MSLTVEKVQQELAAEREKIEQALLAAERDRTRQLLQAESPNPGQYRSAAIKGQWKRMKAYWAKWKGKRGRDK